MARVKAQHVVTLPVNGAWQPTDIATQQANHADFWARRGEWVVLNEDATCVFTGFAHGDMEEQQAAEHFARSMGSPRRGEAWPRALRVQPYWYAPAYGPVEASEVREYRA